MTRVSATVARFLATVALTVATLLMCAMGIWAIGGGHRELQEDDPGWDCHTMGNRVCGD